VDRYFIDCIGFQLAKLEWPIADPDQAGYLQAEVFEQFLDFGGFYLRSASSSASYCCIAGARA